MSYTETTEYKLQRMADDLLTYSESAEGDASKALRKASYAVESAREELKTRKAVGEAIQIAARQRGAMPGPIGFNVLRERRVA
jgi:hypothetical protein